MEMDFSHASVGLKSNEQAQWEWRPDAVEFLDDGSASINSSSVDLFSQYLRSASPSYSSTEVPTDYSGETALTTEAADFSPAAQLTHCPTQQELQQEVHRKAEKPQSNPDGIRIRHRVNPPKARIMLRLTRPKANMRGRRNGK